MRAVSPSLGRTSLALLVLLGGCARLHPGSGLTGATGNQVSEGPAPIVRLVEQPSRADRIVDAAFQVDAPGYALVLAVDLDWRVHVVFPETPAASELVPAHSTRRVTPFYAGRGEGGGGLDLFDAGYPVYGDPLYRDRRLPYRAAVSRHRGAVYLIAVASGRPLRLDRLRDANGGWSERALDSLVFDSHPTYLGQRLGQLVTDPGQAFSSDFRVIANGGSSPLYASSYYRGGYYGGGYYRGGYGRGGYDRGCGHGGYGVGYGTGYVGAALAGEPYAWHGQWLTTGIGIGVPEFGAYSALGVCGPMEIWNRPDQRLRRPPGLFPGDTVVVFTTARLATRMPGAGGGSQPRLVPSGGDPRGGSPDLSRGRTAKPRKLEPESAPATVPSEPVAREQPAHTPARAGRRNIAGFGRGL